MTHDVITYSPVGNNCSKYELADTSATLHTKYHYGSGGDAALCVYDARGNGDGKTTNTLTGDHMNRVTDYTALVAARCLNMSEYAIDGTIGTLKARDFKGGAIDVVTVKKPGQRYTVRRLTPLECCRLQGFPDFWEDGAEGSDTARYKMWGNGIALPCAADVLGRIARAAAEDNDRKENVT